MSVPKLVKEKCYYIPENSSTGIFHQEELIFETHVAEIKAV